MDMKRWFEALTGPRGDRAIPSMPVLLFPAAKKLGVTVRGIVSDPETQARAMKLVCDSFDVAAAVSAMDLSVEAEAFGSKIRFSDGEIPAVTDVLLPDADAAEKLELPKLGAGRTGVFLDALRRAKELITDRPVFAGMIGPFSLAGRLLGVTEIMLLCYDEPETVHTVLRKTSEFLSGYAKAYCGRGADGVLMAEPLTGLLSPDLAEEFSEPYVREIVENAQSDEFSVIYHNCGGGTIRQIDSILRVGAAAYHFGNAISMKEMLPHIPENVPVMGNVDPAGVLKSGTPETVRAETLRILGECAGYPNFVLSSGCDIPPAAPWENLEAFFEAAREFSARGDGAK